jgi:ABC-type Fe3+-hydroxamate transport system substrate-binding protein
MKVNTDLKAGGYVVQAQDQAERFFQKTDQFLNEAGQQLSQAASTTANKLGRVWNCAFQA